MCLTGFPGSYLPIRSGCTRSWLSANQGAARGGCCSPDSSHCPQFLFPASGLCPCWVWVSVLLRVMIIWFVAKGLRIQIIIAFPSPEPIVPGERELCSPSCSCLLQPSWGQQQPPDIPGRSILPIAQDSKPSPQQLQLRESSVRTYRQLSCWPRTRGQDFLKLLHWGWKQECTSMKANKSTIHKTSF